MSIKNLFDNKGTLKIQKSVTTEELVSQVESSDFVDAKRKQFDQFVPPIDFSDPSNFAKFGSAELYYEKAFERISQYYPYDGTLHEKVEFENSSSYLDKYVFENLYPRTNGYVNFDGSQYIKVFGGPHTASIGMDGKPLDSTFDYSMKYREEKKRTSAFEYRGQDGITVEFWLKVPDTSSVRTVFHVSGATGDIKLQLNTSDVFQIIANSGSTSVTESVMSDSTNGTDWNHFAFTMQSGSDGTTFKSYKNGQLVQQSVGTTSAYNIPSILPTTDGQNMWLGSNSAAGSKLSGSLDEFRFWKTTRTPEDIFNTWFIPIGGGTNKHDSNVDLSLYFKFNEGITGLQALDAIVLDYSGRINNGSVVGYSTAFRNTGSAITEKLGQTEFLDPIIYSSHPDVAAKKAEYKASGSFSDLENTSMFYSYFPGWMQEEDTQGGNQLKYLSQVLGSYLDTLWHQIGFVNKIHDQHYISGSNKALPFAKKLLYDQGFVIPDLFVDATKLENLRQKDDNEVFEKEINEVRNTIYHNIYNNLNAIYKTKGTEKSFRNFFRSIGIGQDVVKLKMYADDSTFVLRNNYEYKSYERKFVDFNVNGHFDATLFQTSSANNNNVHIPGDSDFTGSFTLQSEVILPRKQRKNEVNYNPFPYLTSSVMGYKDGSDYTSANNGLQVFVVHSVLESTLNPDDSQRIKFVLTGSNINLETDWFSGQYENNKWSLAVRMKHSTYPRPNIVGSDPDDYLLEFYGVEADGNMERNSFSLSTASIEQALFSSDKIFYAGAHKTNFSGSTLHYTDVKLGYVRYWHSYLSDDAIKQHAFDSETFGTNEPFEQDLVDVYPVEIPREKTLAFHWAFNDLTGSDSSGEFLVSDLSSGSLNSDYGDLSDTIQRYVAAKGIDFNASSSKVLDKNYLYSARKRLPDDLMSSDLTTIKTDETEQFFVDEDVSDNFYSFEKSMWGAISDEMMNMFSTALDLNNLIGQPNQRYHHKYGMSEFLRDRFFDDVENEPDIQKFTSFYKWIDDSISIALQQLVPASARFSEKINNIIESHVLERNKYVHQIPITTNFESTEGSIKGISEMKYDWKHGHAPLDPTNEANNVLWQRDRKKKEGLPETLRNSRNNNSIQSAGLLRIEVDGTARISDTYAVRKFSKTYDLSLASQETIHGGTNFGRKKNLQLFHESVAPVGETGTSGEPKNVVTVGVGAGQGVVEEVLNNDNQPLKKKYAIDAKIGNQFGNEYGHDVHGDFVVPLNVMSGTVNSGYNAEVESKYRQGVYLTNLHNDIVGNYNETSIQGPFTEQHVGGLQYRHIDITHDVEASGSRPEGWGLLIAEHPINPAADGALGFVGADYGTPYPYPRPKATRYRDEHAKRPLNIKNIKTVSGSWKVGNYKNELEIFQINSEKQKTWLIEAYDDPNVDILPPYYSENLPNTTHYQTLVTRKPSDIGNVFGIINNNRQVETSDVVAFALKAESTTTITRENLNDITATGYSTTGPKSFSFWVNLENASTEDRYVMHLKNGLTDVITLRFINSRIYLFVYPSTGGYKQFLWNITISDFVNTWKNITISWNGDLAVNPIMFIDSIPQSVSSVGGTGTGTTINPIDGIYLFDRENNSTLYELQGSMMNFGIWNVELDQTDANNLYNSGVPTTPISQSAIIDFYYLGKDLTGYSFGDTLPSGTIFSSSYGNNNHITTYNNIKVTQGLKREDETGFIIPSPLNNIIASPRTDLTGSQRNISTRFSAPGGPEIQTYGYLDAYTSTYSVHNALPWRNTSVLGSGSGEEGTIRVEDHLGLRRGLSTLRALHMGQFGIDSQYGEITEGIYPTSGSFNKQHRNTSQRMEYSGSSIITGSNYDNAFINTPIPRSELQYSWIHNATSGSDSPVQRIIGYAPRDGIVSSSVGWVEAIVFPSASSIFGS